MTKQDIFYYNLKRLIKIKNIQQKDVADALKVSQQTMSRKIQLKASLTFDDICKILAFFNISYETMTKETF